MDKKTFFDPLGNQVSHSSSFGLLVNLLDLSQICFGMDQKKFLLITQKVKKVPVKRLSGSKSRIIWLTICESQRFESNKKMDQKLDLISDSLYECGAKRVFVENPSGSK